MKTVGLKLEKNSYTVRERTQLDSTPNKYDIFEPENEEVILLCIEEDFDMFSTSLRMVRFNTFTPFQIAIRSPDNEKLFVLRRHPDVFKSQVGLTNSEGEFLFAFNERASVYNSEVILEVADKNENIIYKLISKNEIYYLHENEIIIGKIIHKKVETPLNNILMIDNYSIEIHPSVPSDSPVRILLLLTAVCLDILYFDGIDL